MLALVALLPAAGTALTWRSLQAGVDYTVISRADA
jgi:hypothetical protein